MTTTPAPKLRKRRRLSDARIALDLVSSAFDTTRPLVTNLIITRRCNLSCGYCFEYDKVSPPIAMATLRERIDHLARLRAVFVTLTGGESLLHPEADAIVAYVRERGMTPFLNTNGYLLTVDWIERLNRAGLYALQISVDNVTPNEVSKKSLKTLCACSPSTPASGSGSTACSARARPPRRSRSRARRSGSASTCRPR
jgi:sulfatase maturation enzyme AslB (radical SAM superfamily)